MKPPCLHASPTGRSSSRASRRRSAPHTQEELAADAEAAAGDASRRGDDVVRARPAVAVAGRGARRAARRPSARRAARVRLAAGRRARDPRARFKIPRDEKRRRFAERLRRDDDPRDRETPVAGEAGRAGAACGTSAGETGRDRPRRTRASAARAARDAPRPQRPWQDRGGEGESRPPQGPRPEWRPQAARGTVARRRASNVRGPRIDRQRDASAAVEPKPSARGAKRPESEAVRRRREAPVESEPAARLPAVTSVRGVRAPARSGRRATPVDSEAADRVSGDGKRPWTPKRPPGQGGGNADVHGDRSGRQRKVEAAAREDQAAERGCEAGSAAGTAEAPVAIAAGSRDVRPENPAVAQPRLDARKAPEDSRRGPGGAGRARWRPAARVADERVAAAAVRDDRPRRPASSQAGASPTDSARRSSPNSVWQRRRFHSVRRLRIGRRVRHGLPGYEQLMAEDFEYAVLIEFDDVEGLVAYLRIRSTPRSACTSAQSAAAALAYDYEIERR